MGNASRLGCAAAAALALAGCFGSTDDDDDDGGGNGSCGAVQACGGDVVGVWDITDTCVTGVSVMLEQPECAGAVTIGDIGGTGQMEFTADGQVISNLNLTMQATYKFTAACVSAIAGTPITLDQSFCDSLAMGLNESEGVTSSGCTLSGGACVCPATFQGMSGGMGTWTASGTNLIDEDGTVLPYCVSGDTLTFSGQTENGNVTYVLRRAP